MSYYYTKVLYLNFEDTVQRVIDALNIEGFWLLTEIDVKKSLKNKFGIEFRPYTILGICNRPFAYKALLVEDKIGVMLPCNVIVQQNDNYVEVAAIEPVVSMQAVQNPILDNIALIIQSKLRTAIDSL